MSHLAQILVAIAGMVLAVAAFQAGFVAGMRAERRRRRLVVRQIASRWGWDEPYTTLHQEN